MAVELWGFQGEFYLGLPLRPSGYAALALYALALLGFLLAGLRRFRESARTRSPHLPWLLPLLILVAPLASRAILIRLLVTGAIPAPGVPTESPSPAISLFGAVPWLLAGGLLGPRSAAVVGLAEGLARGGWETESLLTPLQTALVAGLIGWLLRRDYAELPGRLARQPLLMGLLGGLLLAALRTTELLFYSGGSFFDAMDFAMGRVWPMTLAALLEMAVAGAAGEYARQRFRSDWFRPTRLVIGPYNRSLAARLLTTFASVGLAAGAALVLGDWYLARTSARELIETQMVGAARQAGDGIPYFSQVGRSILSGLADQLAAALEAGGLSDADLEPALRTIPYFAELVVYDLDRRVLARAPPGEAPADPLSLDYEAALQSAMNGVPQDVLVPPSAGETVRMVYLWPILGPGSGTPLGVLAAWTDLATNPLLQPVLSQLEGLSPSTGFVIDEQGTIVLHPQARSLGEVVSVPDEPEGVYTDRAPDGTYRLVYVYAIRGHPWRVVVTTPQREVESLATRIAARLAAAAFAVGLAVVGVVYLTSRRLTRPVRVMAAAAEAMARGSLSQPVTLAGEVEIGRLAASFERMRRSLKSRLDETNLLLAASQNMAGSFNLAEVLPPILSGLQGLTGASIVRLVLGPGEVAGAERFEAHSAGELPGSWEFLDAQVFELCRQRGRFVLENPSRAKAVLDLKGVEVPIEALMALPLHNEDVYIGTLWLGHSAPHAFSTDEVNLLSILAGQLGVSVANVGLYHRAEQERRRLQAILAATPDAVLVTDRHGRISLANPAAEVVLQVSAAQALGRLASECVTVPELVQLLTAAPGEGRSAEVTAEGGRVLFATVSEIEPAGVPSAGRVCVLGDITHYKKLDTLKSEFVATVSHDLRAPLTMMRGYATMLSMVGSLTEKQREFVAKILGSIDSMAQLIDNLLDLGRVEAGLGLSLEMVRVETVLRDAVAAHRPQAVNKQITLEIDVQEAMEPIEADATLLRQAIANLLDNALKFTPQRGRVRVTARQEAGRQFISIQDTGVGIAPADKPRLFEKFFRGRRSETLRERGSGLGLAIVKSIAEQHGGRVSVESRLGSGSEFTLDLPIRQPSGGGQQSESGSPEGAPA